MYLKFLTMGKLWEYHGGFDRITVKRSLRFGRDANGKAWFHEKDRQVSYEAWDYADYHEDVSEDVTFVIATCYKGGEMKTFIFAERGYILGEDGNTLESI